jgi:hypothetical protein
MTQEQKLRHALYALMSAHGEHGGDFTREQAAAQLRAYFTLWPDERSAIDIMSGAVCDCRACEALRIKFQTRA